MENLENEIKNRLDLITRNFSKRFKKSVDKEVLLKREIEVNELLFDEKNLPVNKNINSNLRPLIRKGLSYTDGDIARIREAYIKFIVNGVDIKDEGEYFFVKKDSIKPDDLYFIDEKGRYCKKMPPNQTDLHFYIEAQIRYKYLIWLNEFKKPEYTVRSIIMAHYYLYCKGIYPIKELNDSSVTLQNIYAIFASEYGLSANSFHNDWNPFWKYKKNRLNDPTNIKKAIELIRTFDYPGINEAIELANQELIEAELKG
jgi:hypothetical protein